jgi:glyoxylase-like metal-dependent hydrolase (beta-lactamase superfamily II)
MKYWELKTLNTERINMSSVVSFTFNAFQENTYLIYDDTKECVIIDPGCYDQAERDELSLYIERNNLMPVRLLNTHCHIDHVFGNKFVSEKYSLPLEIHEGELPVLEAVPKVSMFYGLPYPEPSPMPEKFIAEGEIIEFGKTKLETLFTPGHSPASISFFCKEDRYVIAGDVLFYQSIGRTDLPGGDFKTLLGSIVDKYFPLGDDVRVYPGHGPATTVGFEKENNPFLK